MDPALIRRAQRGDERAFEAIVVGTHGQLFRVAYAILRDVDAAEDATQRTFLEAWRSLPRLRDRGGFMPWVFARLVELCRRHVADQPDVADGAPDEAPAPVARDPFGLTLDRDQLSRGFGQLSFDDRVVLVLRYLSGLSPEDAGRVLGLGSRALEDRTEGALSALDDALDRDDVSTRALHPATESA